MNYRWRTAVKKPGFWAIVAFVFLFIWGAFREARAVEVDALLGVGGGFSHKSSLIIQETMLEFDEKWEVGVLHMGNDPRIEPTYGVIAARRVHWRDGKTFEPEVVLGAAYFDHAPKQLVSEQLTYLLSAGFRWRGIFDLSWIHYSTAGRAYRNYGVDYVALRVVLPIH